MENYNEKLRIQLGEIENLIAKSNKNLSRLQNLPSYRVRVGKSNGCYQYYRVDEKTQKRVYIPKAKIEELRKNVQRGYELDVNKKLKVMRKRLSDFLNRYDIDEIDKVYCELAEARKKLVIPIEEPKDEFIRKWKDVSYEPMAVDENIEFTSANGVKVRSKSELIIANMLEQAGILYRYEYPVTLRGLGTVRPDFFCLNQRTRKEYIWEHFGMMDNIAYANKNVNKIQNYEQNGFIPGKNMIMTFESSMNPLSSFTIKSMIEEFLI